MRRLATDLLAIEPRATNTNQASQALDDLLGPLASNLCWSILAFPLRFGMGYLIEDEIDAEVRR